MSSTPKSKKRKGKAKAGGTSDKASPAHVRTVSVPPSVPSAKTLATERYAGPVFANAPAPSSLPIPVFASPASQQHSHSHQQHYAHSYSPAPATTNNPLHHPHTLSAMPVLSSSLPPPSPPSMRPSSSSPALHPHGHPSGHFYPTHSHQPAVDGPFTLEMEPAVTDTDLQMKSRNLLRLLQGSNGVPQPPSSLHQYNVRPPPSRNDPAPATPAAHPFSSAPVHGGSQGPFSPLPYPPHTPATGSVHQPSPLPLSAPTSHTVPPSSLSEIPLPASQHGSLARISRDIKDILRMS